MKTKKYPLGRKRDLVIQEVDGELLIYDLEKSKAFCLNQTSALIWQACDGNRDVGAISELVSQQLDAPANEDLVWLALDQLTKEKLLEQVPETDGRFAGLSRREVIKRVGLTSLATIPIVASLVAPVAAQSTSVCFQTCRCDNATMVGFNCGGSDGPIVAPFVNCNTAGGSTMCDCTATGGVNTGGAGFRLGMCEF